MSRTLFGGEEVGGLRMAPVGVLEQAKMEYVASEASAGLPDMVAPTQVPVAVPESFQDKMFDSVREIMSQVPDLSVQVYFKAQANGTKAVYSLDDSSIGPNANTMVGPGFDSKYAKQLGKILTGEGLNEGQMMELISLYSLISKKQYPVQLKSRKYIRLLPKIVVALNAFFNDYRTVLRSMYTMFSSNMQAKSEELKAKQGESTHA